MDIHGTTYLQHYSFHRLVKLFSSVTNATKDPNTDEMTNPAQIAINKMNGTPSRRSWTRTPVQCSICKQFGHSPEKDHICFYSGQLWHTLSHMTLLDKSKIPEVKLKLHQENADKYDKYNIPRNIKMAAQRLQVAESTLHDLDPDIMTTAVADQDYVTSPTSDF